MNNTEYDKVKTKFQNLQGKIDSLYCELQDINSYLYNLYDDIYIHYGILLYRISQRQMNHQIIKTRNCGTDFDKDKKL